jgi:hypothetical protein
MLLEYFSIQSIKIGLTVIMLIHQTPKHALPSELPSACGNTIQSNDVVWWQACK